MDIKKVNKNLSRQDQIDDLNNMILELEGFAYQGNFDVNEISQLYSDIGIDRKYIRNVSLGNTLGNYTNWSHLQEETGYSIWKTSPTSYSYNSLNQLYFDDRLFSNKGEADSESATSFDKVFFYNGDSGSGYTDNTTEAGTEGGTEFSLMDTANDYLYFGEASTFAGAKFEWQTRGSNYTLVVEYWNGSAWTTMTANDNDLDDDTSNFESNGRITWTIPDDWATTTVNNQTKYWIRISTSTTPVTVAKSYYVIPGDNVISLLALSSTEISEEDWAWCSYGSSIYVTIRNSGDSSYEGDYHITSSSSATNLKNYFIYNHIFELDHEDSTYVASGSVLLADGSIALTGNLDLGHNRIINLDDPINPKDAVNLSTLETYLGVENLWDRLSGTTTLKPYYDNDDIDLGSGDFDTTGNVTATAFKIGGTTLDTNEWAYLDGINQALKTGDTVTFNDLTISSPSNIYNLSHDSFTDFVADEHINWKNTSNDLITTGFGRFTRIELDSPDVSIDQSSGGNLIFNDGVTGSIILSSIAKVTLENLSSTAINTNLLPANDANINLGSPSKRWITGYFSAGLRIGTSADATAGTIRWSGSAFEGYSGASWQSFTAAGTDEKLKVDAGATADYLGAANGDGVLRTSSPIVYTDGGNYITLSIDETVINHDNLSGFVSNEHIDWTGTSDDLVTTGVVRASRFELDDPAVSIDQSSGNNLAFTDGVTGTVILSSLAFTDLSNLNCAAFKIDITNTEVSFSGFAGFIETDNGDSGGADTINWGLSNKQKSTLTDDCTFTFTNPASKGNLLLKLVQDSSGSRLVTWPGNVKWPSGTAPTLSTGAYAIDIITFYFDNTSYYGNSSLDFS